MPTGDGKTQEADNRSAVTLCIGVAGSTGSGKTTVALDLVIGRIVQMLQPSDS